MRHGAGELRQRNDNPGAAGLLDLCFADFGRTLMGIDILVADDHELERLGLIRILSENRPHWRVVAGVSTGQAAIEEGRRLRPHVAVLDLLMPGLNGLEVGQRLLEAVPGLRVIILTMYTAKPIVRQLRKAGFSACLAKDEVPGMLVHVVERTLIGKPFLAIGRGRWLANDETEDIPVQFLLTAREMQVLRLLARGKSNKELAAELDIGVRTAESHRAMLLSKLRVDSLGELVRRAVRDGVV
jgi:DNA-binding NarL/FixJ family response regulator